MPRIRGLALAATVSCVLAGCAGPSGAPPSDSVRDGAPQPFGGGTAWTYVELDGQGRPTRIGVRMTPGVLDRLSGDPHDPKNMTTLAIPPNSGTVFDHVTVNWNPHGHPPAGVFDKPHFDVHFYLVDDASVAAIDPGRPDYAVQAATFPAPKYLPRDYVPQAGPPAQTAVPRMGLHWMDSAKSMVPGHYDFTQDFLNGTWNGRYTFMEPMATHEFLAARRSAEGRITQPDAYQRGGYYPRHYTIRFDDPSREYVVSLEDMVRRRPS